jgi:ribosomal protein L24E
MIIILCRGYLNFNYKIFVARTYKQKSLNYSMKKTNPKEVKWVKEINNILKEKKVREKPPKEVISQANGRGKRC